MNEICNKGSCTGCGLCAQICPMKCIEFVEDYEGFFYPYIDNNKCVNCNKCVKNCPILNDTEKDKKRIGKSFFGWSNNTKIRIDSSSGGIFTELADYVLKKDGAVYGAAYTDDYSIKHVKVNKQEELERLRGSKYYQSDIRGVYSRIKEELRTGKRVLFSGTGCQIGALYKYLDTEEKDNLLTVEILCHGVPSKKIICKYIDSIHKDGIVKKISFRDKSKYGWKYSCVFCVEFSDGFKYYGKSSSDLFYLGFLNEVFLRESCYNCKYVGAKRIGDILLADFWGIDNELEISNKDVELGISYVTANNEKAYAILNKLNKEKYISLQDADYESASKYNKALVCNYDRPSDRDKIYKLIDKYGYKKAIRKVFPVMYYRIYLHKIIKAIIRKK